MQIQLLPASTNHEKDAGLATKSTFQESFLLTISWPDIGENPTMPRFFSRIMKGVPKNKAGPRKDEGMVLEPGLHKHIKICHAFSFPSNEYETILAMFKWFTPIKKWGFGIQRVAKLQLCFQHGEVHQSFSEIQRRCALKMSRRVATGMDSLVKSVNIGRLAGKQ